MVLGKDTVFVITGAAGSIVSAITADLAAASGGTFYLLDLTPEPDPANKDLQRLITDKENLKHDLFERLKARGERATPAMVEKEIASLERGARGPGRHPGGQGCRRYGALLQRQPPRSCRGRGSDAGNRRTGRPHRCAGARGGPGDQPLPGGQETGRV